MDFFFFFAEFEMWGSVFLDDPNSKIFCVFFFSFLSTNLECGFFVDFVGFYGLLVRRSLIGCGWNKFNFVRLCI